MNLIFSPTSLKNLKKLDRTIQRRIIAKLEFYCDQEEPLKSAEKLIGSTFGEWRFRIGDYRVLFDVKEEQMIILKIGHRRDVYK